MAEVKELLLNVMFILLPLFLFYMGWLEQHGSALSEKGKWVAGSCFLLSIGLCMTFHISFAPGLYFDLRQIPFLLGVFYLGQRVGVALLVSMLLYRWYLGGDGWYISLFVLPILFTVVHSLSIAYSVASRKAKMAVGATVALLGAGLVASFSALLVPSEPVLLQALRFIIIQGLVMWLAVYVVETALQRISKIDRF